MAVFSMTGYGQADSVNGLSVEIRTVNHRHLDIHCRLPKSLMALERKVKAEVGRHLRRGRVEVTVGSGRSGEGVGTVINTEQMVLFLDCAETMQRQYDGLNTVVDLAQIMALPGVLMPADATVDPEAVAAHLISSVSEACQAVVTMRRDEGNALAADIRQRVALVTEAVARLACRRPEAVLDANRRLRARVAALCAETPLDEARLAQEVAVLADRTDVAEELARLDSHLSQFEGHLTDDKPIGRPLDFLLVEMNREANTIGAKCQDAPMVADVVFIKGELEKVREQVQNVE